MTQVQHQNPATAGEAPARPARIEALRARFEGAGVDALIVSRECDIRYFTGFCGHDSLLLVAHDGAAVISDNRYDEQLNPVREGGVAEVIIGARHRLPQTLPDLCSQFAINRLGVQADHLPVAFRNTIAEAISDVTIVDTTGLVGQLRMCKDDHEIAAIERAIEVNEAAMQALLSAMRAGMTEREIGALLEFEMKRRGASGVGFAPIIAVGPHGSLPHYETADAKLEEGTSLLIDWGALVENYNSDLTRTFAIGSMPAKIEEIYTIVLDAQLAAIEAAAPGRVCSEIDKVARDHITQAGYGEHFGHGLGHGLGLEVHEAPYFNTLQTDVVLEPGMVMTIEPGIYLPGIGGVRIEDDVVITDSGCRVLSSFPKDIASAVLPPNTTPTSEDLFP